MLPFGAAIANHTPKKCALLGFTIPQTIQKPWELKAAGCQWLRQNGDVSRLRWASVWWCPWLPEEGLRRCAWKASWNWGPGVIDRLGRDGSHLGFWWFFGCLGHWDPTSHQDFRHSLDSLILQYWFIRTFIQLWLPGARSHQTLECFHVFRARLQIVVPNSTQRFPENKDSHPQLQLFPYLNHITFISSSPNKYK